MITLVWPPGLLTQRQPYDDTHKIAVSNKSIFLVFTHTPLALSWKQMYVVTAYKIIEILVITQRIKLSSNHIKTKWMTILLYNRITLRLLLLLLNVVYFFNHVMTWLNSTRFICRKLLHIALNDHIYINRRQLKTE